MTLRTEVIRASIHGWSQGWIGLIDCQLRISKSCPRGEIRPLLSTVVRLAVTRLVWYRCAFSGLDHSMFSPLTTPSSHLPLELSSIVLFSSLLLLLTIPVKIHDAAQ